MTAHTTLKYPGSKWSYVNWICSHIPQHKFYLEPYFGSGAVFFSKQPSKYETINDIDSQVVNFFRVCRDHPQELAKIVYFTPFSREEYRSIEEPAAGENIQLTDDPIENARRFLVRCSQGYGSILADRSGWKNTKDSKGPINPQIWSRIPHRIIEAAERLKMAQIENTDAVQLITDCNNPDCFIYADPPYLASVRNKKRLYRHEMMDERSHITLLKSLLNHSGPVMISGYDNDLYNEHLVGWHKAEKEGRANSSAKRTEVIWMNYEIQMAFGGWA